MAMSYSRGQEDKQGSHNRCIMQASTPPSSWYLSPEVAELEKLAIFHRNWLVWSPSPYLHSLHLPPNVIKWPAPAPSCIMTCSAKEATLGQSSKARASCLP